eukprot:m.429827 g.429827  ORF g.429827 m.429827 type:complete len:75 (+) comp21389_c0_seq1:2008-2232(+)
MLHLSALWTSPVIVATYTVCCDAQVYNWQYLYAIRVWSKLLAEEVSPGTKDGTVPRVVLCTTASPPRGCRQRAW